MPRRRRSGSPARRGDLTFEQEFELLAGPDSEHPAFVSDVDRRRAWFDNREELLSSQPPGMRPRFWYIYELELKDRPDFSSTADSKGLVVKGPHELELEWLRKHGHLTVFEERELRRQREAREAS